MSPTLVTNLTMVLLMAMAFGGYAYFRYEDKKEEESLRNTQ